MNKSTDDFFELKGFSADGEYLCTNWGIYRKIQKIEVLGETIFLKKPEKIDIEDFKGETK